MNGKRIMSISTTRTRFQSIRTIASVACLLVGFASGAATQAATSKPAVTEPTTIGAPPTARLITSNQFTNAIAGIFGPDVGSSTRFPPVRRIDGLVALGASTAVITPSLLEMFDSIARDVASTAVDEEHRGALISCKPSDPAKSDEKCAREFLGGVGELLFRRPLTAQEFETYLLAAERAGETLQDFYAGLEFALSGMLVAPQFLYFLETTEPDPENPGVQRIDGSTRAMRLSLLLWDAPPDRELLRAAEAGELHTATGLDRQVERMMASARLEKGVRAFFEDWLIMEAFAVLAKDPVLYPAFNLKVAMDAKEQTLRIIINELVKKKGDYRELFVTRSTFLTQALGAIYRVPVEAAGSTDWSAYELPEDGPRAGLLTQTGFLAVNAHAGRSSPTRRGMALRQIFMCQKVPDPPPNVDFAVFDDADNASLPTARERFTAHSVDEACAKCHIVTDPIGLALENFDGAAQYRKYENGAIIDASGDLDGATYPDAVGLGEAVHDNRRVAACVVKQLYSYGVGRKTNKGDRPILRYFMQQFNGLDYEFLALVRMIATSNAFYQMEDIGGDQTASVASASSTN